MDQILKYFKTWSAIFGASCWREITPLLTPLPDSPIALVWWKGKGSDSSVPETSSSSVVLSLNRSGTDWVMATRGRSLEGATCCGRPGARALVSRRSTCGGPAAEQRLRSGPFPPREVSRGRGGEVLAGP